jgi:hypothetical protein
MILLRARVMGTRIRTDWTQIFLFLDKIAGLTGFLPADVLGHGFGQIGHRFFCF